MGRSDFLSNGEAMNEFITTGVAAKVIAGSARTIAKLFDTGVIKGFRAMNDRRIHTESFKQYLKSVSTDNATYMTLLLRLERYSNG